MGSETLDISSLERLAVRPRTNIDDNARSIDAALLKLRVRLRLRVRDMLRLTARLELSVAGAGLMTSSSSSGEP
jgi:hypothetical protein